MKIAFDLDKTYYANRKLFNHIASRFQEAGHQVGILTGRHESEGADVDFIPDFVYFLDIGELSYAARAVVKAQKMKDEHIDFIFDDRAEYFPPSTVALHIL